MSAFSIAKERIIVWFIAKQKEAVGIGFFVVMLLLGNYTIFAAKGTNIITLIRLPVLLKTAEGLSQGAHVFSHGVRVGYVASLSSVGLDSKGQPLPFQKTKEALAYGQGVVAVLSLNRNFIFYPNYRIITKHRTVLAEKIIEILPGDSENWGMQTLPGNPYPWPEGTPVDQPVPYLKLSHSEVQLLRQKGVLPRRGHLLIASNYDDPLYLFAAVVVENREDFLHITSNLRDISYKINSGTGSIGAFINRPDIAEGANEFLKETIHLTHEVRTGAESLRESDSVIRFGLLAFTVGLWWISQGQN